MGNRFWLIPLMGIVLAVSSCASTKEKKTVRTISSVNSPSSASAGLSIITRKQTSSILSNRIRLAWPLNETRLSRGYNGSFSSPHDGIDIPAPTGAKISASEGGKVIYSGRAFHGYGKMILIEHGEGIATLYAHCSKILVKSGQKVLKGKIIGLVGRTGHASAPHLHFEVRQDRRPIDPMEFFQ